MQNTALIHAREREGLTQRAVAEKAHIPVQTYNRYETGRREPKVGIAQVIADLLNSTVPELFGMYKERVPQ